MRGEYGDYRRVAPILGMGPGHFRQARKALEQRGLPRPSMMGVYDLEEVREWCVSQREGPWVYIVGYSEFVKIGFSNKLSKRLADLQAQAPATLQVYGKIEGRFAQERKLHRIFAEYRTRGEWFLREGQLDEWIKSGCPSSILQG